MTWQMKVPKNIRLISQDGDVYHIEGDGLAPVAFDVDVEPPPVTPPPPASDRWPAPLPGEDTSDFVYPSGEPWYPMDPNGDRTYPASRYPPGATACFALDSVGNPGGFRSAGIAAEGAHTDYGWHVGGQRCWVHGLEVEAIDPRTMTTIRVPPPPGYIVRRLLQYGRIIP